MKPNGDEREISSLVEEVRKVVQERRSAVWHTEEERANYLATLTEANRILRDLDISTTESVIVQGNLVQVAVLQHPSTDEAIRAWLSDPEDPEVRGGGSHENSRNPAVDQQTSFGSAVSVMILPSTMNCSALARVPVVLRLADAPSRARFGRLNSFGQVTFSGLEQGQYRAQLTTAGAAEAIGTLVTTPTWLQLLLSGMRSLLEKLVPLPVENAVAIWSTASRSYGTSSQEGDQRLPSRRYANADNSLKVTLWERESGDVEADFRAEGRRWDGTIVAFAWNETPDQASNGAGVSQTTAQLRFAPLAWSDVFGACVAEVSLGRLPPLFQACIIDTPVPVEEVPDELVAVVEKSVHNAGSEHTRRAWSTLGGSPTIPRQLAAAIQQALDADSRPSGSCSCSGGATKMAVEWQTGPAELVTIVR